jgi:hypothetical protein
MYFVWLKGCDGVVFNRGFKTTEGAANGAKSFCGFCIHYACCQSLFISRDLSCRYPAR